MSSDLRLTFCAVTIQRPRIEDFLRHHQPIAQDPRAEWLIFCPSHDREALEAEWTGRYRRLRFLANDTILSLNERRNYLLGEAAGDSIIFFDDDSFLAEPEPMLGPLLYAAETHPWVLLSRRNFGQDDPPIVPKSFAVGEGGSGIEWNQLFRVTDLRKVGGWDPRFGPGALWCSGEAFVLMFTMSKAGYHQHPCPEVAISHPAQAVKRDLSNLSKFRSYRKAMGTMLAYLRPRMTRWEFTTWLLRLTVAPLPGALLAAAKGDFPLAALRACTPFDILGGICSFQTETSRVAAARLSPQKAQT